MTQDFSKPFDKELRDKSSVGKMMPEYKDIPNEFKGGSTIWNRAMKDWFYQGTAKARFTVKEGIVANDAFIHLGKILQSWDPKHEHKEAGVAYLMSLWFTDYNHKINKP